MTQTLRSRSGSRLPGKVADIREVGKIGNTSEKQREKKSNSNVGSKDDDYDWQNDSNNDMKSDGNPLSFDIDHESQINPVEYTGDIASHRNSYDLSNREDFNPTNSTNHSNSHTTHTEKPTSSGAPLEPTQDQVLSPFTSFPRDLFTLNKDLDNKGSVARDHLANERTFLAWVRTAMGFAAFSVAFLLFYRLEHRVVVEGDPNTVSTLPSSMRHDYNKLHNMLKYTRSLSLVCAVVSIVTVVLGLMRYVHVQYTMITGNFPATRLPILLLVVVTMAMLITLIVMDFSMVL